MTDRNALLIGSLAALLLPGFAPAQQPGGYPYNIQINQGQYPYYSSPYLYRTYQDGIWAYHYYPPNTIYAPPAPPAARKEAPAKQTAVLNIFVPVEDATVWIEGKKTDQKGMKRRFESPLLEHGASYLYEVRVEWMQNGKKVVRSEDIPVRAGRESSLHFFGG
jgi:uncharacterized protein (TIGR03000 family)